MSLRWLALLIQLCRPRSNGLLFRLIRTRYFKCSNSLQLWTPFTTLEERRRVYREIRGHCLNCHGTDHSVRTYPAPLTNSSHCLNPALVRLGLNGETCRRWQRCIQSYCRPPNGFVITHARGLRHTTAKNRLVARVKGTTAIKATGTPTLVSLVMVRVLQGAFKAVARHPFC